MIVRIAIASTVLVAPLLAAPLHAQPTGSHPSAHATPTSAPLRTAARTAARGRSDVRVLTVVARDYAFDAPSSIEAGLVDIRLENRGNEMHHIQLVRLAEGKTMRDLFDALSAGGPPPAWAKDVGGPNTPVPGGTSAAMVRLKAGRYVMLCFIPSPDGKMHVMKGMAKELTVTPPTTSASAAAKGAATDEPRADVTMTLRDYDFVLSTPLRVGKQVIRVRNEAAQSHEVVLVKLAPGKTAADVVAWVEKHDGPPPGVPLGGTTGIARNGENIVAVDLEPGQYALLCFIPDAKDGKPHFVHGMMKQIEIATESRR